MIGGALLARACLASLMLSGAAQAETCRLALVLALDISSSVDAAEDALQRQGLAAALLAPEVQTAILSGDPIAVSVFEWSGRYNQRIIASWRMLRHPQDIAGLSRTIAASRRSYSEFPTAMGYALRFGADLFDMRQLPVPHAGYGWRRAEQRRGRPLGCLSGSHLCRDHRERAGGQRRRLRGRG